MPKDSHPFQSNVHWIIIHYYILINHCVLIIPYLHKHCCFLFRYRILLILQVLNCVLLEMLLNKTQRKEQA